MEKLLVKLLVLALLFTGLLLALSNATLISALVTALGIGVLSYLLGDLLILPRTNNMVATIADAGMVFVLLWIIREAANWTLSFPEMLLLTVLAGGFEYIFHMWLLRDHGPVRRQRA